MGNKLILLATVSAISSISMLSTAYAGEHYVTAFGGLNLMKDVGILSGTGSPKTENFTILHIDPVFGNHDHALSFSGNTEFEMEGTTENGFVVGAAVGTNLFAQWPSLRFELEASYRKNAVDGLNVATLHDHDIEFLHDVGSVVLPAGVTPVGPISPTGVMPGSGGFINGEFVGHFTYSAAGSGDIKTTAVMANMWIDGGKIGSLTPYLGAGFGWARSEIEAANVFQGEASNFAFQIGAGLNYPVTEQVSLGAGFRYLDAGKVELDVYSPTSGAVVAQKSYDVESASVLLALTFKP